MNIAIIEYKTDIDEALDYFPPQNSLYLSVSAEASYHLSERNIKFLTDEDVLTPAVFKEIGDENFEITKKWIQQLEETLQTKNPIFKKRQFYPFRWHFYRLKILVDAVRIKKVLIERLIEKEQPLLIGMPVGAIPEEIHDHHLFFHKYDSLYGLLGQKIAAERRIEIKTWRRIGYTPKKFHIVKKMKDYLKILKKFLRVMSETKNLLQRTQTKGNILLGNVGYDIEPIRKRLSNKFNLYYYKNPLNIISLRSFLKLKTFIQGCKFPNINLKGIFKTIKPTGDLVVDKILGDRIQSYAERFIHILWIGLNYLESVDRQNNFKAYIHSAGASDSFCGLMVYYFSRINKPIFIIQHGAYGFALNKHTEYCEFGHDGYFFAWGDGIKEMYEKRKKGNCKIISTGSHLIEGIKKNRRIRKTINKICYIPSMYRGYTAYYPNGQSCLDSKMFIMEIGFLLALRYYQDKFQITYKVHPGAVKDDPLFGKNPMLEWIGKNFPMMYIESRPLVSIIHEFDLFIIDWPSTTLVQACATGAEIVVYTGNQYFTLSAKALDMLKKRAIVGFDEDDFKNKIKFILDKGIVISDVENTSFIEKYGIYRNDGKSLKRMVDNLLVYAESD